MLVHLAEAFGDYHDHGAGGHLFNLFNCHLFRKNGLREPSETNALGVDGHVSVEEDGLGDCVTSPLVL